MGNSGSTVFRIRWLLLCTLAASAAQGGERSIRSSDLPLPVQDAVTRLSADAAIRGLTEETDGGETRYELELRIDGHSKDVLLDSAGNVEEVEEEVEFGTLPETVRKGLEAGAGTGKVTLVESISRDGKLIAYEAHVRSGRRRAEIQVDSEGRLLEAKQ